MEIAIDPDTFPAALADAIETLARIQDRGPSGLARRLGDSGSIYRQLKDGQDIGIRRAMRLLAALSDAWPAEVPWPAALPRLEARAAA